ncbi:MAG: alpha/beta hydrolase [Betaproteobacteria bacterium]|nr:alpha/beta hydrolase [Betaproteobacteria bacterium]MDE2209807.1 alpha/beta hydrolase [Betaproteobacteria bacterium]MDE2359577.1 alpha/beta hydrolase [Betaproteobacteria bacterium]
MTTPGNLPSPGAATLRHPVRFVEASGHRLEYVDIPAHQVRRPPLVFLHEGLGSVAMWRDFPARVAAVTGCRAIAYSRYGSGRSSRRIEPYLPRFMHEEALRILPVLRAELGIASPVLIGHSTGASMALIHAGAEGSDVAGLVVMAPLVFVEQSNLDSIRAAQAVYRTTDMRQKLARYHDDVDGVFWGWNDIWLDSRFRSWSIADDLRGIRCPILAILGDDDPYSTPAQIDAIRHSAVSAAGLEFLKLPDCRHSPHRDQSSTVIDAIGRFVDALPA